MSDKLIQECKKDRPDFDYIKYLVENGENIGREYINYYNEELPLPILIIHLYDVEDIILYLLEKNKDHIVNPEHINIFHLAVEYGKYNLVKLLIRERLYMIDYKSNDLSTPLMISIKRNYNLITTLLIETDVRLIQCMDIEHRTPIHIAIQKNNYGIIKLLIEKGADINACDRYHRRTPLIYAVKFNSIRITTLIIDKGADINKQDVNGKTALFEAFFNENYFIVELLIERGADLEIKDTSGRSVLDHAKIAGNEIFQLLKKQTFNKKTKMCNICRNKSDYNILIYLSYECPICFEKKDKVYTYNCGHINCCDGCFNKI